MGHGCHDCGCPNGCECPEVVAERERMWSKRLDNPAHDSLFMRFEQLEKLVNGDALKLVKLIRAQVLK